MNLVYMDLLYIVGAYLLGSIPFGLLLAKLGGHGDIRNIGSGNIGATNVLRTGNKFLAALTLLLDIVKGMVAVYLSFLSHDVFIIFGAGLFAVLGHMYPLWLKFKGGKGVATTLGVMFALMPPLGLAMIAIWLLMAVVFRISSLAALTSFTAAPLLAYFWLADANLALLAILLYGLVVWKHKDNIGRILSGTEPKIGKKKDNEPAASGN